MAREGRQISSSGVYQILLRGVDKLFLHKEDYTEFLNRLRLQSESGSMRLLAYLLLPNRVQLLIDTGNDNPSKALKPLCTSYARYFNRTYHTQGKLFYDRFKSVGCENAYDISDTAAFFHAIGEQFSVQGMSSLGEYNYNAELCDTNRLFELCGPGADIHNPHTFRLDDYDRLSPSELDTYIAVVSGLSKSALANLDRYSDSFTLLFSGKGATSRKLMPLFGIHQKPAAQKKEEPQKTEPAAKKKDLSVWLL